MIQTEFAFNWIPADILVFLQNIQEEEPEALLTSLYKAVRRAYLFRMNGIDKTTSFALFVKEHRTMTNLYSLDDAYNRIARHYRETYHPHGQRILQFDDTSYEEILRQGWEAYFVQETERLLDEETLIITMLSLFVYEDEEPEFAARDFLDALLNLRYEHVPWI